MGRAIRCCRGRRLTTAGSGRSIGRRPTRNGATPSCASTSPSWGRWRSTSWRGGCRRSATVRSRCPRVLALLGTYARADAIAALEGVVRACAYSLAAVERIVAVQAWPRTVLEALAEEERPDCC